MALLALTIAIMQATYVVVHKLHIITMGPPIVIRVAIMEQAQIRQTLNQLHL